MKKRKTMKVSRGRLDIEKNKSDSVEIYQRALLFLLPFIMISVLSVGIFFGYKSYTRGYHTIDGDFTATTATESQLSDSDIRYLLTIVNSANPMDRSFEPTITDFNGVLLSPLVTADLIRMLSDAGDSGVNLRVQSGYISFEEQKELYETAVKKYKKNNKCSTVRAEAAVKKTIPKPGECEQQTGLLLSLTADSDADFKSTPEYSWLIKNSVKYGFVLRYPDSENTGGLKFSPNLFRYVGLEYAKQMRAYNMNLDEFVEYVSAQ